jgi:hypothetical protein
MAGQLLGRAQEHEILEREAVFAAGAATGLEESFLDERADLSRRQPEESGGLGDSIPRGETGLFDVVDLVLHEITPDPVPDPGADRRLDRGEEDQPD